MTPADDGRSDFAGVTWRAEARARLYGVGIGVRVADADHLPPLLAHLPHGSILDPTGNVDRLYSALLQEDRGAPAFHLYAGGRRIEIDPLFVGRRIVVLTRSVVVRRRGGVRGLRRI